MPKEPDDAYGLPPESSAAERTAPDLPYKPQDPQRYRPRIGLIGCGGISVQHLRAYSAAGYDVAVLCDRHEDRARKAQQTFYPKASTCTDFRDVLRRADVEVVDLAAHPEDRAALFGPAIDAGKHILSQKPFVTDIDLGLRIVERADRAGVRLAVNQNGRWAPHWSWIREAVASGLMGEISSVRMAVNWDHRWVSGTPFAEMRDLILYDFGIHWFDIVSCFMGGREAKRLYASRSRAPGQSMSAPLLAQAVVEYEDAQAALFFDASARYGEQDVTFVTGARATASSVGPNLNSQAVTFSTTEGRARPALEGAWFPDGFHGAMGELLRAVEERREPSNGARGNLASLALCFAAVQSAAAGRPVKPGSARRLLE